jgi:molybdopterin-guanine dinucleotide biosynthesis protein A
MPAADLYIIAAGNGSRINANLPKALIPILDEPCMTTTLRQIAPRFRRVFVVTNVLAWTEWYRYFRRLEVAYPQLAKLTTNLPIKSGLGDGHATLQALLAAERLEVEALAEDIVILWGDAFVRDGQLIDELLSQPLTGSGLFPVVHENHPYVALLVNEMMQGISVEFSKFGETHGGGFHDQCVFRFLRPKLKACLQELHNSLWRNSRYMAPGGELSLLYSVHQLYNSGNPVCAYETSYPTLSFNTVEDVLAIQQQMRSRGEQPAAPSWTGQ